MILTGNTYSTLFPVSRSSRQGCPLSPTLFALSLEPLAQMIRSSSVIKPITVHNTHHHLALYADDILVFLGDPLQSAPHLLTVLDEFGTLSGFGINWSKSALMPLNEAARTSALPANIPSVTHFKYLGIDVFSSLHLIVKHNYTETLNKVLGDLERWASLPNTLQARISIIKRNVLPRINFVSFMVPLCPLVGYWSKLHKAVSKFIWNGKRPLLRSATVQRRRLDGGLAGPNFKLYHWSFTLRPLVVWFDPQKAVAWHTMEERMVHPWSLADVLFANISVR